MCSKFRPQSLFNIHLTEKVRSYWISLGVPFCTPNTILGKKRVIGSFLFSIRIGFPSRVKRGNQYSATRPCESHLLVGQSCCVQPAVRILHLNIYQPQRQCVRWKLFEVFVREEVGGWVVVLVVGFFKNCKLFRL